MITPTRTTLLLMFLASFAWAQDKSKQLADMIAPFIDEQTVAVGCADLSSIDMEAVRQWLADAAKKVNVPAPAADDRDFAFVSNWIASFRKAGGRYMFVVINPGDVPYVPVVIPLEEGADAKAISALMEGESKGWKSEVIGRAIVFAEASTMERLHKLKPAARPDLAAAFAVAGEAPLRGAFFPSADLRRIIAELMPNLPKEAGGGSTEPISKGLSWAGAGIGLPPRPSVNLVMQCQDAASAKALSDLIGSVLTAFKNIPDVKGEVGNVEQFVAAVAPRLNGDRLTLNLDSDTIDNKLIPMLAPSIVQAQERANRIKSASNLRQIGQAAMLYLNDQKDKEKKYPPDLGTMVTAEDLNPEVFISPSSGKTVPKSVLSAAPKDQAKWVNVNADYVYLGVGMEPKFSAEVILAYEKPEIHKGEGGNVLYGDGSVQWVSDIPALMKAIEKQKQSGAK